jgi:transcriptional regulator with XRE-family HTH domain
MLPLIKELQRTLKSKNLSPEYAAGYIGCTGNQIRRWFKGISNPTPLYRDAIRAGIEKMKGAEL